MSSAIDLVGFLVDPLGGLEVSVGHGLFLGRLCRLGDLGRDLDASLGVVVEDGGGFQRVRSSSSFGFCLVHDGSSTSSVSRERAGTGLGGRRKSLGAPVGRAPAQRGRIGGRRKTRQNGRPDAAGTLSRAG